MAEGQVTEEMGVHFLGVLSRPCQPETNRHLGMPEEQLSIGDGQTKIDRQQYLGHRSAERSTTRLSSPKSELTPKSRGEACAAGVRRR